MTEDLENRLVESWIRNAESWTRAVRESRIESRRLVTDDAVVDAVLSCGGSRILDVGCGEGWLTRCLSAQDLNVVAFDGSARLVDRARQLGGGRFLVLSYSMFVENPDAVSREYDVAVSNFSLLGENIRPVLRAIGHATGPAGQLVIQTVHPTTMENRPHENGWREEAFEPLVPLEFSAMPWYFRTLESWIAELEESGWRTVEVRDPVNPRTGNAASLIVIANRGARMGKSPAA